MNRLAVPIAVVAFLFSSVAVAEDGPRVWVVAVGVSKYVRALQPLAYAADGANRLAKVLSDARPQTTRAVILSTDSSDASLQPTKTNLLRELKQLAQRVKPDDLIVFYFCGHGVESAGRQLLLMTDADLTDKETADSSTVGLAWLREKLESLPCNGRLLWLDACRESAESLRVSGGVTSAVTMSGDFLTSGGGWQTQPGRVSATLFGCKEGEKVYHGKSGSFFTDALVDGLAGKAADQEGQVTLASLSDYVRKRVPEAAADELGASVRQEPVMMPSVVSDVVLRPGVGHIACLRFDGENGDLFAETVQTRLVSSGAVRLVERLRLADALKELKLRDTAAVDASSARELGKLVGAKYVLVGSSRKGPDGKFHVNCRLVVAETGQDMPGVAARCSAEPEEWEPAVLAMAGDLLNRMRGSVLPEDAEIAEPEPAQPPKPERITPPPVAYEPEPNKGQVKVNPIDGAEMVYVPAGEFIMGSNDGYVDQRPEHKVYLDGYWMYKYEVTVAQYRKFREATGRKMPRAPEWGWLNEHPMVNVTWDDAAAYAKWAGGRLPTEAEWEKAARGTDGRVYPWGNEWDAARCNNPGTGLTKTALVGAFPSGVSPYGCQDMAGNVWEWCADWYEGTYYRVSPARNPKGPTSGTHRVLRGGGWSYGYDSGSRCAYRDDHDPYSWYSDYIGFRLAR